MNGTTAALIMQQTGQVFPLNQSLVTIGRRNSNTIVLNDDLRASRQHATITCQADGQYLIEDMDSANGTFVNEHRITGPHPLSDGDMVRVGATLFSVLVPEDQEVTLVETLPDKGQVDSALNLPGKSARPKPPPSAPLSYPELPSEPVAAPPSLLSAKRAEASRPNWPLFIGIGAVILLLVCVIILLFILLNTGESSGACAPLITTNPQLLF